MKGDTGQVSLLLRILLSLGARRLEGSLMSGENLAQLAERFLRLTGEVEEVRRSMLTVLTNGGGEKPEIPFSKPVRASGGSQPSQHPNAAKAAEAEETIRTLLRERPMRMGEITAAMAAKQSTTSERLRRLRQRGQVTLDGGAWAASG
jgi:hypothetical protein